MKYNKTKKMIQIAILASLGIILSLLEIPYPFAPWLTIDLSDIVVLISVSTLGVIPMIFVCICKFFVSILFKGPIGPIAIGQITAFIGSLTIGLTYYYIKKLTNSKNHTASYLINISITTILFSIIMVIINYLFVTPTYLLNKPAWYTNLHYSINSTSLIQPTNIPRFLQFLSPYGSAIILIYFPFNFLKCIINMISYQLIEPIETKFIQTKK